MKNLSVKDLVLMAFYVALFMVLDTFVNTLGIFQMPNGGSLGVSTLALLMASYHLGWKKGLFVSVVSVFAQFVTGPMYTPDLLGFFTRLFISIQCIWNRMFVSKLWLFLYRCIGNKLHSFCLFNHFWNCRVGC